MDWYTCLTIVLEQTKSRLLFGLGASAAGWSLPSSACVVASGQLSIMKYAVLGFRDVFFGARNLRLCRVLGKNSVRTS